MARRPQSVPFTFGPRTNTVVATSVDAPPPVERAPVITDVDLPVVEAAPSAVAPLSIPAIDIRPIQIKEIK